MGIHALLRPTEIKVSKNNQAQMDHRYSYDAINLTSKQTLDGTTTYAYDNLDRLTQATPPATLQAAPTHLPVEQYGYDAVHNRTSSQHQPGTWTYGPDNQLMSFGEGAEQTSLEYDGNGHQVKRTVNGTVTQYRYDAAERLTEIAGGNGATTASYAYDPFGRRIRKTVGAQVTWYQYGDEGLIAEYDPAGSIQTSYGWLPGKLWGTSPVVMRKPNAANQPIYFYHNDHLGTPQQMTDTAGNVVWLGRAEAFGRTRVDAASTVTNPFRFPGQYEDQETGTFYNYFRDYDPSTGRYVEADPIGLKGGYNTYSYVNGNPLSYTDPMGLEATGFDCLGCHHPPPVPPGTKFQPPSDGNGGSGDGSGAAGSGAGAGNCKDCHEHYVSCLGSSLADRFGSVFGSRRCQMCNEACNRGGGHWPSEVATTRGSVRCDYWNH